MEQDRTSSAAAWQADTRKCQNGLLDLQDPASNLGKVVRATNSARLLIFADELLQRSSDSRRSLENG